MYLCMYVCIHSCEPFLFFQKTRKMNFCSEYRIWIVMACLMSIHQGVHSVVEMSCHASRSTSPSSTDVTVAGLFAIHGPEENGGRGCGKISVDNYQLIEAMRWTFENLTKQDFVPGISIGMLIFLNLVIFSPLAWIKEA